MSCQCHREADWYYFHQYHLYTWAHFYHVILGICSQLLKTLLIWILLHFFVLAQAVKYAGWIENKLSGILVFLWKLYSIKCQCEDWLPWPAWTAWQWHVIQKGWKAIWCSYVEPVDIQRVWMSGLEYHGGSKATLGWWNRPQAARSEAICLRDEIWRWHPNPRRRSSRMPTMIQVWYYQLEKFSPGFLMSDCWLALPVSIPPTYL
jgi:hypothetical protein